MVSTKALFLAAILDIPLAATPRIMKQSGTWAVYPGQLTLRNVAMPQTIAYFADELVSWLMEDPVTRIFIPLSQCEQPPPVPLVPEDLDALVSEATPVGFRRLMVDYAAFAVQQRRANPPAQTVCPPFMQKTVSIVVDDIENTKALAWVSHECSRVRSITFHSRYGPQELRFRIDLMPGGLFVPDAGPEHADLVKNSAYVLLHKDDLVPQIVATTLLPQCSWVSALSSISSQQRTFLCFGITQLAKALPALLGQNAATCTLAYFRPSGKRGLPLNKAMADVARLLQLPLEGLAFDVASAKLAQQWAGSTHCRLITPRAPSTPHDSAWTPPRDVAAFLAHMSNFHTTHSSTQAIPALCSALLTGRNRRHAELESIPDALRVIRSVLLGKSRSKRYRAAQKAACPVGVESDA
jgi:hypothetical protein